MPTATATPLEVEFDEVVDRLGVDQGAYTSALTRINMVNRDASPRDRLRAALLVALIQSPDVPPLVKELCQHYGVLRQYDLNDMLVGHSVTSCAKCGLTMTNAIASVCSRCLEDLRMERQQREREQRARREVTEHFTGTTVNWSRRPFRDEYMDEDDDPNDRPLPF